jgi:RNA polymerase sigma-70 factor (ECF subfamily)
MESSSGDVTRLLNDMRAGEQGAESRLADLVYNDLRRLAAARMRSERGEHTLSPTALANEAWVRFASDIPERDVENRRQFFAIAVTAMRRILIEHARARGADKRGGDMDRLDLDAVDVAAPNDRQLIALDEALTQFATIRPRAAHIIELRFFGGFTHSEIATLLGIERRTVDRDWSFARAWLFGELRSHVGRQGT